MRTTRPARLVTAAGACAIAAQAIAGLNPFTGVEWVEVDNSSADPASDPAGAALWNSQPSWRTFDLLLLGTPGAEFNAINMGFGPNPDQEPFYLFTDATAIFNYPGPAGGDVQSGFEGLFNLTRFDTFVDLGGLNPNGTAPAQIGTLGMTLSGVQETVNGIEGWVIRGTWFEFPPNSAALDANGQARLMRITISADATILGGNGSAIQVGTDEGTFILLIPAPSSLGILAIAGVAIARRRR
jgi:hypothetical protein